MRHSSCVRTHLDSWLYHGIGISTRTGSECRISAPQFVGTSEAIVKRLYAQNIN